MDKLKDYGKLIVNLLNRHAEMINRSRATDIETAAIFDDARNHYMLFRIGWRHKERVHTAILYLRIRNGKIWIEEDASGYCAGFSSSEYASADSVCSSVKSGFYGLFRGKIYATYRNF